LARQAGAKLVLNSDSHAPKDLVLPAFADKVGRAAGLSIAEVDQARENARRLLSRRQAIP
jgi:histidinol phosphatase-like PHP family hydrolase